MLPEQQGRHCLACSKTVIDFTNWETADILSYLQEKPAERVCGRFNLDQVTPAAPMESNQLIKKVLRARMPLLRKIAAVIVICFGLLQQDDVYAQNVKGKVAYVKPAPEEQMQGEIAMPADSLKQNPPVKIDSLPPQPQMMGMVAPYKPKLNSKVNTGTKLIIKKKKR